MGIPDSSLPPKKRNQRPAIWRQSYPGTSEGAFLLLQENPFICRQENCGPERERCLPQAHSKYVLVLAPKLLPTPGLGQSSAPA